MWTAVLDAFRAYVHGRARENAGTDRLEEMIRASTSATPSQETTVPNRPPVRQSTIVRSDVDHTFEAFVRMIGAWWPVEPLSLGGSRVRDVTVEQGLGGRIFETWDDGTTVDWGEVIAWDPPGRFVMSWMNTPAPTEVELTFTSLGPALTRVAVEHRGWERLSQEQLGEDCAEPGGYLGGSYSRGWLLVLERFAGSLESEPTSPGGSV